MTNQQSKYPLLPYSQLVWEMTRWNPRVYLFPSTVCWHEGANQKDHVEKAYREALANHPVFSTRIDWRGRQYAVVLNDILHGKYHDVKIYTKGEDLFICAWSSRILGDGKSIAILAEDVFRAYNDLPLEKDDYWGYVARFEQGKTTSHYKDSCGWLIREFDYENVPVHPTIDRKWLKTIFPPKSGLYKGDYTSSQKKILQLKEDAYLSLEGIFSLCSALAIAEYCGTDSAALTWAYEGREKPEEQHIFGSLHRDVPFIIRKSKIENRESAIRLARNQIRSGIAHSDYPYTLTYPYSRHWNYAVNVLRVDDAENIQKILSLPFEVVSLPEQKYAYALLDVEIHEHADSLQLWYRYSASHYKLESIRKFAALVRKYVEWLINNL